MHSVLHLIAHRVRRSIQRAEMVVSLSNAVKSALSNQLQELQTMSTALAQLQAADAAEAQAIAIVQQALQDEITRVNEALSTIAGSGGDDKALAAVTADLTQHVDALKTIADALGKVAPAPAAPQPVVTEVALHLVTASPVEGSPIDLGGQVNGSTTVTPTGTVKITDPSGAIDVEAALDSNGGFSAQIPSAPAGSYSLNAAYSGDANNQPSSGSLGITVAAAPADQGTAGTAGAAQA